VEQPVVILGSRVRVGVAGLAAELEVAEAVSATFADRYAVMYL
jgi:hypothetical protein